MNQAENNRKKTPCPVGEPGQEGYTELSKEPTEIILEEDMGKSIIVCSLKYLCPKVCKTMGYALCTETEGKCEYQILIGSDTSDSDEKFPYVIGEEAEIFHNGEWKTGLKAAKQYGAEKPEKIYIDRHRRGEGGSQRRILL